MSWSTEGSSLAPLPARVQPSGVRYEAIQEPVLAPPVFVISDFIYICISDIES